LFVIGSMKSGTTFLCRLLRAHPAVFMSDPKEPCYFVDPQALRRAWKWPYREGYWRSEERYLALFAKAGAATVIGEASTVYSRAPLFSGVPQRILRFSPEARIVYLMRDPVERAISHYWHRARGWRESRAPLPAIRADSQYVDTSSYARQLAIYLEHLPLERIYTLTLEELIADPAGQISRLYAWLNIDPAIRPGNTDKVVGARPRWFEQARGFGILDRLRRTSLYGYARPMLPKAVRRAGHGLAVRGVTPHEVDTTEAIQFLRAALRPDAQELGRVLKRTFPEWSVLSGGAYTAVARNRSAPASFASYEPIEDPEG
jgi:hypothetical protein